MPIIYDANTQATSHYEYVSEVPRDLVVASQLVKKTALQSMDQLEGWCTKYKASVLMDIIFMKKPEIVVEIGVFGGKSLIPMAYALKENRKGIIYGIDPWTNMASIEGMDGGNKEYWGRIDHDAVLFGLMQKIKQFHLNDQVSLIRATSEDAPLISDIDILHIDGNHSEKTSMFDALKWVPLVKKGGIIIFDDITWGTTDKAVKWMDENCIRIATFTETNSWGIWIQP